MQLGRKTKFRLRRSGVRLIFRKGNKNTVKNTTFALKSRNDMSSKEHEHTEDSGRSREAGDGAERTRPDAAADGVPGGARTSGRSRSGRSVPAGRGAASGENAGAAEGRPRRARLRLPFDNRREDAGEWAYDHRIGLCITLIAYLVLMIAFVSSKIVVGRKPHTQGMYIDLQTLAELEQERDRLERLARERQEKDPIDWRSIQNQVSNENALNEKLRDDRGTNAAALNDAAAAAEERMRANREAYEQGLAEERAIRQHRGAGEDSEHQDRKVKGRVTVSFSLTDPVRTSRYLAVPAYKCEGGGEVVVEITVNRAGDVTNARVVEGGDECMRSSALGSARRSRFNIDDSAPARQQGTITYIFIPQ